MNDDKDTTLDYIRSLMRKYPSILDGEATVYILLKILDTLERIEASISSIDTDIWNDHHNK